MNRRILFLSERLSAGGTALLVCGFGGAVTGALASLAIAVLFVGPSALYAALWGALSGFCAAVCGRGGLGGPLAWKLSGAFWGSYGGYNIAVLLSRASPPPVGDGFLLATLLALGVSGFVGWTLGAFAESRLELSATNAVQVGAGARLDLHSPLSSLPFPIRLGLVACILLPVLVTVPTALSHIWSVWSWMLEMR